MKFIKANMNTLFTSLGWRVSAISADMHALLMKSKAELDKQN
jgi:hypothetical protein